MIRVSRSARFQPPLMRTARLDNRKLWATMTCRLNGSRSIKRNSKSLVSSLIFHHAAVTNPFEMNSSAMTSLDETFLSPSMFDVSFGYDVDGVNLKRPGFRPCRFRISVDTPSQTHCQEAEVLDHRMYAVLYQGALH
jgi:hypothetical protein